MTAPALALEADFSTHYQVDPQTGFLRAGAHTDDKFDPVLKVLWVSTYREQFPLVMKTCKEVGIDYQTYLSHYARDLEFRNQVDAVRLERVQAIEAVRYAVSLRPNGVMDRMAVLNAEMKDRYNPTAKIEVEHRYTREEALTRSSKLQEVIDAEIVEKVRAFKRERVNARQVQLKAGKL